MSVRQVESLIRLLKGKPIKTSKKKDPNILNLEQILEEKIGIKVTIENKKNNSGLIRFEYKGLDQLNRLIDIVKVNY